MLGTYILLVIANIIDCTAYSPCISEARSTALFVTLVITRVKLFQHQKIDEDTVVLQLTAVILGDRRVSEKL